VAADQQHPLAETQAVWAQAVDRVKQTVIAPSLWRALEKTVAVVWEDNNFVIGFGGTDGQLAGQLNTRDYRLAIERAIRDLTGGAADTVRIIEGTEISDWEFVKTRDAAAAAARMQTAERQQRQTTSFGNWDEVYDQVSRLWASSEFRSLPTGRARYIDAALTLVQKAMDAGLYPADGTPSNELMERGLSRVIERIANQSNSDPVIVASFLFQRRKAAGGTGGAGE